VRHVLWWRARGAQRATRGPYAPLSLALDAAPASGQYRIDTPNREAASYAIARTIAVIEAGGEAVCRMSVRLGKRRSKASVVPVAQSVVPLAHSAIATYALANALSLFFPRIHHCWSGQSRLAPTQKSFSFFVWGWRETWSPSCRPGLRLHTRLSVVVVVLIC